jgi:hypothetical protein
MHVTGLSAIHGEGQSEMAVSKFCSSLLVGLLPLFATVASAGPVGFTFTGHVTDDAINGCGGVVNCGVVTGSYAFDSAALDGNPDPAVGLYAASSITLSIDGVLFFSSASGFINVVNFPAVDQYGVLATGVASNLSMADLSILLADPTAAAFSSDTLPLSGASLALLLPGTFQLNAADDSFQLLGTIDSVAGSTSGPPPSVPEPSSVMLLALGVSFLLARRRGLAGCWKTPETAC